MSNPVVLTIYGKGTDPEFVTVNQFEDDREADNYMRLTENPELYEDRWVSCIKTEAWHRYILKRPKKIKFNSVIPELGDREIQRVLREIDSTTLAKALKDSTEETQDKIFRNMSKRAVSMLKEDMEFMGPARKDDIDSAQREIVGIVQQLQYRGDIDNEALD
jgi:Mg/Co/Ni transporter MgtE